MLYSRNMDLPPSTSCRLVTSMANSPEVRPPTADLLLAQCDETSQVPNERVIQAYEQERLRLAREIHDGPAQVLANAVFELEYFERLLDRDPVAARAELAKLRKDIRNGLADVRRFIYDLRPPALSDAGLFAALDRYVADYQKRFDIEVDATLPDDLHRLPTRKEVAIFRIIQEALQNVRRHAGASRVTIKGNIDEQTLGISVEDDGKGFEPSAVSARQPKSFGLTSMRERAELIDGRLRLESAPGRGTRIALTVPLE